MGTGQATDQAPERTVGYLVYGVVPGDVETTGDARGLADATVTTVAHGRIGALVSEVTLDRPLGTPDDLMAYQRLLDSTATAAPVLPMRFGTAMTDVDAVEHLLAEQHDQFAEALERLDGHTEFVVRARYVMDSVLPEILASNEEAGALRDQIREQPEELTGNARLQLGEIIYRTIEAGRQQETQRLIEALGDTVAVCRELAPTHEEDAAHLAVMVPTAHRDKFEQALRKLADGDWRDRVTVRLLGPLAPYDFVQASESGN
jgi:hypothetical protein